VGREPPIASVAQERCLYERKMLLRWAKDSLVPTTWTQEEELWQGVEASV
jgi:hypothetical protein